MSCEGGPMQSSPLLEGGKLPLERRQGATGKAVSEPPGRRRVASRKEASLFLYIDTAEIRNKDTDKKFRVFRRLRKTGAIRRPCQPACSTHFRKPRMTHAENGAPDPNPRHGPCGLGPELTPTVMLSCVPRHRSFGGNESAGRMQNMSDKPDQKASTENSMTESLATSNDRVRLDLRAWGEHDAGAAQALDSWMLCGVAWHQ